MMGMMMTERFLGIGRGAMEASMGALRWDARRGKRSPFAPIPYVLSLSLIRGSNN